MRLVRNLTAGEIVGQVMLARDALGEWPSQPEGRMLSNIVMMGMGEPLYNFDNVRDALKIVMDGDGLGLSRRRITLSTSGVVPMMARAGEEIGVNLAVSLHAVTKEVRDEIVPINRKYGIDELLAACAAYPGANNARRITFEYVMLKDKNDSDDDARELVRLIRKYKLPAKVNLIPFNPVAGRRLRMLGRRAHPPLFRHRLRSGHLGADPPPARPRHHGRLRPVEVRRREEEPRRARPHRRRKAGGAGLRRPGRNPVKRREGVDRLARRPPTIDRMAFVGVTERHSAIEDPLLRQCRESRRHRLVDQRPGLLRDRWRGRGRRRAASTFWMNMPRCAHCGGPKSRWIEKKRPTGAPNSVEIVRELDEPRRPVTAWEYRSRRRAARPSRSAGSATVRPALADRPEIRSLRPAGFVGESWPRTRAFSSASGAAGDDVDMPGLEIAARRREAGDLQDFGDRLARHRPVEKSPALTGRAITACVHRVHAKAFLLAPHWSGFRVIAGLTSWPSPACIA